MGFLSGLVSAGAGLLGDVLGSKSASKTTSDTNAANYAQSKEFAQNGIQWKVADAKAAGIHPLYAMGAQTMSPTAAVQGDYSKSDVFKSMGQNVSRAAAAVQTSDQRLVNDLTTENMKLQNDMLRAQIGNEVAKQPRGPAVPGSPTVIPGQGDTSKPSWDYSMNADGSLDITPSQDFTDKNQNVISGIVPEAKNFLRNQLFPGTGGHPDYLNRGGQIFERRGSSYYPLSKSSKSSKPYYPAGYFSGQKS